MSSIGIFSIILLFIICFKYYSETGFSFREAKSKLLFLFMIVILITLLYEHCCLNNVSQITVHFVLVCYALYFILVILGYFFSMINCNVPLKTPLNYIGIPIFGIAYFLLLFFAYKYDFLMIGNNDYSNYLTLSLAVIIIFFVINYIKYKNSRDNLRSTIVFCFIPILCLVIDCLFDYFYIFSASFVILIFLITNDLNINFIMRDKLTGMRNRLWLDKDIRHFSHKSLIAVFFIDVNNLKIINDKLGHAKGDEAIQTIATAIKSASSVDTCYRIGGDEFILLCDIDKKEQAEEIKVQIIEHISISNTNNKTNFSCSIGYDVVSSHKHIRKAISNADERMYKEKIKFKRNK